MALKTILKRLVFFLCAGIFAPGGALAQSIVFDGREVAGHFDARARDALEDRVDGVIVVAANGGRIIHLDRYGRMGVGTEALETAKILIPLDRVSVLFTTLLALGLEAEGRLPLDRDVNTLLSRLAIPAEGDAVITVRDLITSRAGFESVTSPLFSRDPAALTLTPEAMMPYLRPLRPPGALADSGTIGFGLLGIVIADTTGRSYRENLHSRLLAPLNLTDSFAGPPPYDRLADCAEGGTFDCRPLYAANLAEAGAGVWSTAGDMARLLAVLTSSDAGALGRTRRDRLLKPDWTQEPPAPLGLDIFDYAGRRALGRAGCSRDIASLVVFFPEADTAFFLAARLGRTARRGVLCTAPLHDLVAAVVPKILPRTFGYDPAPSLEAVPPGFFVDMSRPSRWLGRRAFEQPLTALRRRQPAAVFTAATGRPAPVEPVAARLEDGIWYLQMADGRTFRKANLFANPSLTVYPLAPAILVLFAAALYLLPGFAGRRRRLALFALAGGALFAGGGLSETAFFASSILTDGADWFGIVWRLMTNLGLIALLVVPMFVFSLARDEIRGPGIGGIAEGVFHILLSAAALYLFLMGVVWGVAGQLVI